MPEVFYQLETIGNFIREQLKDIDNLECTEENKKEVRKRKQEITATKNLLEDKRKEIKNKILEPYNIFNKKYEEEVKGQLEDAEKKLDNKVKSIENEQKEEKINRLKTFFKNYQQDLHIESYSNFDDIGLNVTLSASDKSLEKQILDYCNKVEQDLKLIELEDYKDEILVEYRDVKDYAKAKINVFERHKKLEEISNKEVKRIENLKVDKVNEEKIEEITSPVEIDEELITVSFEVTTTKDNIRKIKQFLIENNISYK